MTSTKNYLCLDAPQLEKFLLRRRATLNFPSDSRFGENLVEIIRKANEFVPSSAGSILLDNPLHKAAKGRDNKLHFIAAFGASAEGLIGQQIPVDRGIAGHVYSTGQSYLSADVSNDRLFYPGVDAETSYSTRSLVAIPIRIEQQVCGVLELINREGVPEFTQRDLDLLEIFAGYISVSIQTVLDARQAGEIARRDNLTGLYNDRYLHLGLSRAVANAQKTDTDLALLFLDLDRFKLVNDTHGHLAGSQVLREVGWELRDLLDYPSSIAARYGGDEFVLAIPNMDLDGALELAEEVRFRVARKVFITSPGDIHADPLHLQGITCSVGIATLQRHVPKGLDLEPSKSALLRAADTAMYKAKEGGRNCVEIARDGGATLGVPLGRRFQTSD